MRLKTIERICAARRDPSVTDWSFYQMIDLLAANYFWIGVAIGLCAGLLAGIFLVRGH